MRCRILSLAIACAAAASGCERMPALDPHPSSVEPAGSDGTAPTPIVIHGSGFHARVTQDGAGGASAVDVSHRVWIDDVVELTDATWVDAGTLRATVPAGLSLGPHSLTVENALGRRGRLDGAFTVIVPASLSAAASVAPTVASTGQAISLALTVSNSGGAPVLGIVPEISASGTGALNPLPAPPPVDLGPGEQGEIVVSLRAETPGDATLSATVRGVEAFTGREVLARASAGPILLERAARLRGSLALPSTVQPGSPFTATLRVTNEGEAAALGVVPGTLALAAGSSATFTVQGGPTPASADVAGGATATYTWSCTLADAGPLVLLGSASGTDANGGWPVETGPLLSNLGSQNPEILAGPSDPFGDGLSGGMLAKFDERIYWGPSVSGSELYSRDAAGNEKVSGLTLGVDLGSSRAANAAWRANPPAATIGATGCAPGTLLCGPNDEGARGVLAAGKLGGAERLVLAGAPASRGPQYLYFHTAGGTLDFAFLDLFRLVGPQTLAPTAAYFVPGAMPGTRLYAGFAAPGGNQAPVLLAITSAPPAAGLDAAQGTDAIDLRADIMPFLGGGGSPPNLSPIPRIDLVQRVADTIYVANGGGIMASTVPEPGSYFARPGDWAIATPSDPAYGFRASVPSDRATDLTPADRAFPALAQYAVAGAKPVFAARNVSGTSPPVVPQLWMCQPGLSGDAQRCDPDDWSLAAPNEKGDRTLTQLGDPANGAISVLVATSRYLYVGFDNAATGVQLFRTELVPAVPGDFRGRDGCAAGSPGCEGLGGNGLGDPAAHTRFFDAEVLSADGRTSLFVLAGNGTDPSRLFELPE